MKANTKTKIIVLIGLLLFSVAFIVVSYRVEENRKEIELEVQSEIYTERLTNEFVDYFSTTSIIKALIELDDDEFSQGEFNRVVALLYSEDTMDLIYYAPDGIIKWVYPQTELNDNTVGINIFADPATSVTANWVRENNKAVLDGPYISGYTDTPVLAVRSPINKTIDGEPQFVGFATVLFKSEKVVSLLTTPASSIIDNNFIFSIHSMYNSEETVLYKDEALDYDKAHANDFNVSNTHWTLYLDYKNRDEMLVQTIIQSALMAIVISVVVYIFFLIYLWGKAKQYDEIYLDSLTKIHNRKSIPKVIPKMKSYIFFFIDLNKFKPVNDTYGHEMGDKLLIAYAQRLKHRFNNDSLPLRLGGDEFGLLINGSLNDDEIQSITNRLINLSSETFVLDGIDINISSAVGFASYPKDGNSIEEIMELADQRMYENKKCRR